MSSNSSSWVERYSGVGASSTSASSVSTASHQPHHQSAESALVLTGISQAALWGTFAIFAAQAALHWVRATCVALSTRAQQHELLAAAATAVSALLYQGMASGVSLWRRHPPAAAAVAAAAAATKQHRVFFGFWHVERALAGGLTLLNIVALSRERQPAALAVASLWLADTLAVCLGSTVEGKRRQAGFLAAAVLLLLPISGTLLAVMGSRVLNSPLEPAFRFLTAWFVLCGVCYCLMFFLCEVAGIFNSETEVLASALLDFCTVGVSSLVLTCWASPEVQAGLLPNQEAELSLLPGPHLRGFFPNPDYYDDNL